MSSVTRRGFLQGMLAAASAPAIVKISSLMPVKATRFVGLGSNRILYATGQSSLAQAGDMQFDGTWLRIYDGTNWQFIPVYQ